MRKDRVDVLPIVHSASRENVCFHMGITKACNKHMRKSTKNNHHVVLRQKCSTCLDAQLSALPVAALSVVSTKM